MSSDTSINEWPRHVRMLTYTEIADLSKNAIAFHNLMSSYGVEYSVDRLTSAGLDVLFAKWIDDQSSEKQSSPKLISILGITFGNYLCDRFSMRWVEVIDVAGTTYAVVHEKAEVYCFPLEAVKKRTLSREIGFFVQIEEAVRRDILDSSTKRRE